MLGIYLLGLGSGYRLWGIPTPEQLAAHRQEAEMENIMAQVNPAEGYTVAAHFSHMGPKMGGDGVFDGTAFEQVYQQANQPLSEEQLRILKEGSDSPIVFNRQNAYFLLNYF